MNVFDLQAALTLDTSKYDSALQESEGKASSWASGLKKAGAIVGGGIAVAGGAIVKGVNDVSKYGDKVDKMSQKLGLSTDAYQQWDYVMQLAGADINSMGAGVKTLTNKLQSAKDGTASSVEAFEKLGLSVEDLSNMTQEELFETTIKSLAGMEEGTERAALANELLGKSGMNLAPLLNMTTEEIDEMLGAAQEYGMVMSEDAVKASAAYQDSLTTLQGVMGGIKNGLLSELLPAFTNVVTGATDMVAGTKAAFEDGGMLGAISFLGESIYNGVSTAVGNLVDFLGQKFPAMKTFFENVKKLWETIKENIKGILENLKTIIETIVNNIKAFWEKWGTSIKAFAEGIWNGIKTVIETVMGVIRGVIQTVTGLISGDWSKVWEGIKGIASSIWDGIKGLIENTLNTIKSVVSNIVENIKNTIKSKFEAAKNTVTSIFDSIKNKIQTTIETARDKVKSAIEKIKSFFKFEWSLPKLKMPHLTITGEFSLMPPSTPSFSIEWYKKAYNNAYLFSKPTIGVGLGFGDGVGGEMVVGENYLQKKIGDAMEERVGNLAAKMEQIYEFLQVYFPIFASMQMVLDSGELVGSIAPLMDAELGRISTRKERG